MVAVTGGRLDVVSFFQASRVRVALCRSVSVEEVWGRCLQWLKLSSWLVGVTHSLGAVLSIARPGNCRFLEFFLVVDILSTSTASYSQYSRLAIDGAGSVCGTIQSGLESTVLLCFCGGQK